MSFQNTKLLRYGISSDERHINKEEEKKCKDKEKYISTEIEWKRMSGGTIKLEKHLHANTENPSNLVTNSDSNIFFGFQRPFLGYQE